jgi:hypothetical protein
MFFLLVLSDLSQKLAALLPPQKSAISADFSAFRLNDVFAIREKRHVFGHAQICLPAA